MSIYYIMGNYENSSHGYTSGESTHLEQRTTALAALAKIIAKAHLRKMLSHKNDSIEIALPNNRNNYINDDGNGDGSHL